MAMSVGSGPHDIRRAASTRMHLTGMAELEFFVVDEATSPAIGAVSASAEEAAPSRKPPRQGIDNAIQDFRAVAGVQGSDHLVWPALVRRLDRMDPGFRT